MFFSKYHNFVKNSRTTIKFIPNALWEQKEEICRWNLKTNENLLIFDDFGKTKSIQGKKFGSEVEKLVTSQLQNALEAEVPKSDTFRICDKDWNLIQFRRFVSILILSFVILVVQTDLIRFTK